jgi:hypothetical protein
MKSRSYFIENKNIYNIFLHEIFLGQTIANN